MQLDIFPAYKTKWGETTDIKICLLICITWESHLKFKFNIFIIYIYIFLTYIYKHQFLYYSLLSLKTITCVLVRKIQIIFILCNSSSFYIKKCFSHPTLPFKHYSTAYLHLLILSLCTTIFCTLPTVPGQCHQWDTDLGLVKSTCSKYNFIIVRTSPHLLTSSNLEEGS